MGVGRMVGTIQPFVESLRDKLAKLDPWNGVLIDFLTQCCQDKN